MGVSVRQKPRNSGIWWIFLEHNGVHRSKRVGKDKKVALEVAEKIRAKLVLEEFDLDEKKSEIPTFGVYAEMWHSGYVKGILRDSTHERYAGLLKKYIIPVLGKFPLDQVKRSDVKKLIIFLYKDGLSKSSVALCRNVLSSLFNHALDEGIVSVNPASGILKQLKLENSKRIQIEPLTPEEVTTFLSTCQGSFPEHYPFFLTAFRTGMRLGELLGLRWGDIDWNGRFIQVRRSHKRGSDGPTKNGKDRRIDLSDHLLKELRRLYVSRKEEAMAKGWGGEISDYVFHKGGKPIEQNDARRLFKKILSQAGIREIRFHDIRHTFASLLLSNGCSIVYVKDQMGHQSIQITVEKC